MNKIHRSYDLNADLNNDLIKKKETRHFIYVMRIERISLVFVCFVFFFACSPIGPN